MLQRMVCLTLLMMGLCFGGGLHCGGGSQAIATIEISNCPSTLLPGETLTLTVLAKDASGNVIGGVSFSFSSSNDRFAFVGAANLLTALYPSAVSITASADGVTSSACNVTVNPLPNTGTVTDITDNGVEDNWGQLNNFWRMISRGRVFWQRNNDTVLIHDVSDPVGTDTTVKSGIAGGIDFMAFGSGAGNNDIMGSWREGLADTFVTNGSDTPTNLGDNLQEENTIDAGCLFFRMNAVLDIMRFTFADGLTTAASTGELGNPISSNCLSIWLEKVGGGDFDLIYWDGNTSTPVATGPFIQGQYDFRNGRVVYSLNSDVFLYDTTAANPQSVNITNRPQDLNDFVKTDGDSIIFTRAVNGGADNDVVLYDIASQSQTIISTTDDPKEGRSLEIDLKQAVWWEGSTLFFHNGNGMASGTSTVPLGGATLNTNFKAYIADAIVTWIGTAVDDDVYVMQ